MRSFHIELMNNPIRMKELFYKYLDLRIKNCAEKLAKAAARSELTDHEDFISWNGGHFGKQTYSTMLEFRDLYSDYPWETIRRKPGFTLCLNQIIKEMYKSEDTCYDYFLAFFELYTCEMLNKNK